MDNQPTFRIGISMAGAVSAGAYTACNYRLKTAQHFG